MSSGKTLWEIIEAALAGDRPEYDDLRLALCAMHHMKSLDEQALALLADAERKGPKPFPARGAVYQHVEHNIRVIKALSKTPLAYLGDNNNPDNLKAQAARKKYMELAERFMGGEALSPQLGREYATHDLVCTHAIGSARKVYLMPCHVLKVMPDCRLKLQVYGERHWNDERRDKVTVRYVEASRVRLKRR